MKTLGKTKLIYCRESSSPPPLGDSAKQKEFDHTRERTLSENAESILSSIVSRTAKQSRPHSRVSNVTPGMGENIADVDQEAQKLRARTQELLLAASKLKDSISGLNFERPASPVASTDTRIDIEQVVHTGKSKSPTRVLENKSSIFGNSRNELDVHWQERQQRTKREKEQIQGLLEEIDHLRKQLVAIQREQRQQSQQTDGDGVRLKSENRRLQKALEESQQTLIQLRNEKDELEIREERHRKKLHKLSLERSTADSNNEAWTEFRKAFVKLLNAKSIPKLKLLISELSALEIREELSAQPFVSATVGLADRLLRRVQQCLEKLDDATLDDESSVQDETIYKALSQLLKDLQEGFTNASEHVVSVLKQSNELREKRTKIGNITEAQVSKLETLLDQERQRNNHLERRLEVLLLDLQEHQQATRLQPPVKPNVIRPDEQLLEQIDVLIDSNKDARVRQVALSQKVANLQRENEKLKSLLHNTQQNADAISKIAEQNDEQSRVDLQLEKQKLSRQVDSLEDRLEEEKLQVAKREQVIKVLKRENHELQARAAAFGPSTKVAELPGATGLDLESAIDALLGQKRTPSKKARDDVSEELDELTLLSQARADRDLSKLLNGASEKLQQHMNRSAALEQQLVDTQNQLHAKEQQLCAVECEFERVKDYLNTYETQYAKVAAAGSGLNSLPADILSIVREHGGDTVLTELMTAAVSNTDDQDPSSKHHRGAEDSVANSRHPLPFAKTFLRLHALYVSSSHTLTRLQQKHSEQSKLVQSQKIQIDALSSENETVIAKLVRADENFASHQRQARAQFDQLQREHSLKVKQLKQELASQSDDISNLKQINGDLAKKIKQIIVGYQQTFSE